MSTGLIVSVVSVIGIAGNSKKIISGVNQWTLRKKVISGLLLFILFIIYYIWICRPAHVSLDNNILDMDIESKKLDANITKIEKDAGSEVDTAQTLLIHNLYTSNLLHCKAIHKLYKSSKKSQRIDDIIFLLFVFSSIPAIIGLSDKLSS